MIELRGAGKRYRDGWAIRDVTLQIRPGDLLAIVGESGSGKTTLLRMINRLLDADEGTVLVDGKDVATVDPVTLRRSIGYVIQSAGLFPHLTIADNIALVPRLLGWREADITARVDELLGLVALTPATYRGRLPDQLSGGQRQRVGIARALAARPKVMLLDEPFGALDPLTRVALQDEISRIHRELQLTTVMVTHDLVEALTLADRIAVVYRGQLRQVGAPKELMHAPSDDYVATLIGMAKRHVAALEAL